MKRRYGDIIGGAAYAAASEIRLEALGGRGGWDVEEGEVVTEKGAKLGSIVLGVVGY